MNTEALTKYIIAIAKLKENDEAESLIQDLLKEIVNSEKKRCLQIIEKKEKEWCDTAVRVNRITKDLIKIINEIN